MTERDNGQTRALQERGKFDTQEFATAVYQSELTLRLRILGYQLESGRSGHRRSRATPANTWKASSPRSQQIREHLRQTGFQGPEVAQIAAHGTRDGKEIHSTAEVMAAHYKVAAAHGDQAEAVIADQRPPAQLVDRACGRCSAQSTGGSVLRKRTGLRAGACQRLGQQPTAAERRPAQRSRAL